uniref:Conotoxin Bu28 n=1 Tax=Conus bullatus TaxID=89438 RepID=CJE28_CONBU|nr:RecName: Full=Conotoxin Bu28; Flags: Precursor [Conus bullatus]
MTSVQSATCCCLLWLVLCVQLVTPDSPATAQLSRHLTARVPVGPALAYACSVMCAKGYDTVVCTCTRRRGVVSSSI